MKTLTLLVAHTGEGVADPVTHMEMLGADKTWDNTMFKHLFFLLHQRRDAKFYVFNDPYHCKEGNVLLKELGDQWGIMDFLKLFGHDRLPNTDAHGLPDFYIACRDEKEGVTTFLYVKPG